MIDMISRYWKGCFEQGDDAHVVNFVGGIAQASVNGRIVRVLLDLAAESYIWL
ncbi:hypothetical protein SDC9_06635 [bioreactor metagenome]|uniref:Uncharacterized protein n=1 Tax=bioreactor metagenome TaxID=1076179 RepID=A0A644T2D3_9ZZZZ